MNTVATEREVVRRVTRSAAASTVESSVREMVSVVWWCSLPIATWELGIIVLIAGGRGASGDASLVRSPAAAAADRRRRRCDRCSTNHACCRLRPFFELGSLTRPHAQARARGGRPHCHAHQEQERRGTVIVDRYRGLINYCYYQQCTTM